MELLLTNYAFMECNGSLKQTLFSEDCNKTIISLHLCTSVMWNSDTANSIVDFTEYQIKQLSAVTVSGRVSWVIACHLGSVGIIIDAETPLKNQMKETFEQYLYL